MGAYPEPRPQESPRPGPISMLLRIVFGLLALAIPIFALWLCSAMVLAAGAPLWLSITAGVGLVLVVPFVWDLWAEARFSRRQNPPPRILTRADRLRLRILAICVAFSGFVLFAFGPFATGALASRGDWVLFGAQGSFAADVRAQIVRVSRALGGLSGADTASSTLAHRPSEDRSGLLPDLGASPLPSTPIPDSPPLAPDPRPVSGVPKWPLPVEVHPVILSLGDSVSSLAEVAEAIAKREADPFQRVKAIHDFAVTWLSYDTAALDPSYAIPSQEAEAVFARRTATCNGYVNVMLALASRTGDKIVRIAGRSRVDGVALDGFRHAWAAATIDGRSYLIDPTWNAGAVSGLDFEARYSTSYLFAPPEYFAYDHHPDDASWYLLDPAPTLTEFLSRPVLNAHFFAWGLRMEGITKAQTEVSDGRISFRIRNPRKAWVLILARPRQSDGSYGKSYSCLAPSQAETLDVSCPVTPGNWDLQLYANDKEGGSFPIIGVLSVQSR